MKRFLFIISMIAACTQLSTVNSQVSITRERVFTGAGLYGFMNGGADLYLEYEVFRLTNRDIEYKGEKFTVDIYELPTPEDAFGIYSMNVFRCQRADTLGGVDCLSPYQLQAVVGSHFVSVVFPSGSTEAMKLADEVLRLFESVDGQKNPAFPNEFIDKPPYSGVLKYLRGPLSVSSASKDLSNRVKDTTYKGIWFKEEKREDRYEAYILFAGEKDKEDLKKNLSASDILAEGEDFLYLQGEEKEDDTPDYGPFGF